MATDDSRTSGGGAAPTPPARPTGERVETFGLLLIPGFSLITFASFLEPLRQANRLLGRDVYAWRLLSVDGSPVMASSGTQIMVDGDLSSAGEIDYGFVCAGVDVAAFDDKRAYAWLRKLARHGTKVGAVSTATFILARAGVLDGYRATIHWESLASFREQHPDLELTTNLFEIDGNRITGAGAAASVDLMLHLIGERFGYALVAAISEQYNLSQIRAAIDDQRMPAHLRLRSSHPKLLAAIGLMEGNIEAPFDLAGVAATVGLSKRQLERLFHRHIGTSVMRHYRFLRLRRANMLLTQTNLPVSQVAVACGYQSQSHFAKDYRRQFGCTPVKERSGGGYPGAGAGG